MRGYPLVFACAGCLFGALPGQAQINPSNILPAPGSLPVPPGTAVSPSQVPDSSKLKPEQEVARPTTRLQTTPGQLPVGQRFTEQPTAPRNSVLLRQGTESERALAVYERPLIDYDPMGLELPGFFLFPSVDLGYRFDNNLFASPSGKQSDNIFSISPTLAFRSQFAEDQLNVDISSVSQFYATHDTENSDDYQGSVNGRYYLTPTIVTFGRASVARLHEARGSPNAVGAALEPTPYDDYRAFGGIAQTQLELTGQADVFFERLNFSNALTAAGPISLRSRDYDHLIANGRVGYELSPEAILFVRGTFDDREYFTTTSGFDKDSQGYAGVFGADLDVNDAVFAEVFAGVMSQDFKDSRFSTITTPAFGVDAVWNLTANASLLLNLQRTIDETTLRASPTQLSSAIVTTSLTAGAQYQFLDNLLGRLNYFHVNYDYRQSPFADDVDGIAASAKYFLSRRISFSPTATFDQRSSNRPGRSYDEAQLALVVTLAY